MQNKRFVVLSNNTHHTKILYYVNVFLSSKETIIYKSRPPTQLGFGNALNINAIYVF